MRHAKYVYTFDACVSEDDMCALCAVPYDDASLDVIDDILEDDDVEDVLRNCLHDHIRSKVAERVLARRAAMNADPTWL